MRHLDAGLSRSFRALRTCSHYSYESVRHRDPGRDEPGIIETEIEWNTNR